MKKIISFVSALALVAAALFLMVACDPGADSQDNRSDADGADAKDSPKSPNTKFYAARPTQYTWPLANQSPLQTADSLLTQNYYLVIDGSGSMEDSGCSGNQSKIDVAKSAVDQFVTNIPQNANIGLLVFDLVGIQERVALAKDPELVKQKVYAIQAGGGTPLLSAITTAYEAITLQAQKQFGYGEYHLIVVTDGEANKGQDPKPIVKKILSESPVVIHTIGFCIGSGHSLNKPGITNYRAANNPEELLAGLQNVLAESNAYSKTDGTKTADGSVDVGAETFKEVNTRE